MTKLTWQLDRGCLVRDPEAEAKQMAFKPKISVRLKKEYGNHRYYPNSFFTHDLLKLMGRKSLTSEQLEMIKDMDWIVEID